MPTWTPFYKQRNRSDPYFLPAGTMLPVEEGFPALPCCLCPFESPAKLLLYIKESSRAVSMRCAWAAAAARGEKQQKLKSKRRKALCPLGSVPLWKVCTWPMVGADMFPTFDNKLCIFIHVHPCPVTGIISEFSHVHEWAQSMYL